ncbi:MAG: hypothetical protein DME85_02475 [Verrucomicrobia bacterium]|nr:MAG: hypothetical protein DME85_02475 [Verrucomicrobiota bacterium]
MHDRRILVITGAGVSAESGIPTFRGKDGYWRNRDPAKLATPEAFARDPKLVWEWYRERWCKFTEIFLQRAARGAISQMKIGVVHLNHPAVAQLSKARD